MNITRKDVANKIADYLYHDITSDELTDWAESAMMEADFESEYFEILRNIISRLGLADVKAFGISWEDCENFLKMLGYQVKINISEAKTG